MTTCAVVTWSLLILVACIAGVVAISRYIDRTAARICGEHDYEPY